MGLFPSMWSSSKIKFFCCSLLSCEIPPEGNDEFASAIFSPDVPPEVHFPSLELCRQYQPKLSPGACLDNDVPHDTFHKPLLDANPFRSPGVAFSEYPNFCDTERETFAAMEAAKCSPNNPDAFDPPSHCVPRPLLMDPSTSFPLFVPAARAPPPVPPSPFPAQPAVPQTEPSLQQLFPPVQGKLLSPSKFQKNFFFFLLSTTAICEKKSRSWFPSPASNIYK